MPKKEKTYGDLTRFVLLFSILNSKKNNYNSLTELVDEIGIENSHPLFIKTFKFLVVKKAIKKIGNNGKSILIEINKEILCSIIETDKIYCNVEKYILHSNNRWRLIQKFIDSTPVSQRGFKLTI